MSFAKHLIPLALATFCLSSWAQEDGAITPYRPSVSSPAQLPLPGQLELELGGLTSRAGAIRRTSLPYEFKLAFNPEWGIRLGGEAYVTTRDDNGQVRGFGDTNLILKRAFLVSEATAFGAEFSVKEPTARNTIGSGVHDYTLNGIYSQDLDKVHMDVNLNLTRLGMVDADSSRTQTGMSASFSLPVSEQWGLTLEPSGTRRTHAPSSAQFLMATTYSPNKRLTFDFGAIKGLSSVTPNWSYFAGVVFPIARLW